MGVTEAPGSARAKRSTKSSHKRASHSHSSSHSHRSRGSSRSKERSSKRGSKHQAKAHKAKGHHHHHHATARRPRYAYPFEMFMMSAPKFDESPLPPEQAAEVTRAFVRGAADKYPPRTLVRAGIVKFHPMKGGIYWRREPVKYIIMHSTEPGRYGISGVRIIESWSSMGRRHPGAQYVVDRDGTIYQSVDPELATVHINIFKTLPGINNDNTIGIEMNHNGGQDYPEAQVHAVIQLVNYLQERYNVSSDNVITHRYAQQGDHTDPVNFNWPGFIARKDKMRVEALAMKLGELERQSADWKNEPESEPSTFLQPHSAMNSGVPTSAPTVTTTTTTTTIRTIRKDGADAPTPGTEVQIEERTTTVEKHTAPLPVLRGPIEVAPTDVNQMNLPAAEDAPDLVP